MVTANDPLTNIFATGDQVALNFAKAIDTTTRLIDAIEEIVEFFTGLSDSELQMYSPSMVRELEGQIVALRLVLADLAVGALPLIAGAGHLG